MPLAPKSRGVSRLRLLDPFRVVLSPLAWLIGLAHEDTVRLNSPAAAMLARPIRPSLTAIQRVRLTLWFQVIRKVPASSSLVTSGAPQKRPMTAGARYRTPRPTKYSTASTPLIWFRKLLTAVPQSLRA